MSAIAWGVKSLQTRLYTSEMEPGVRFRTMVQDHCKPGMMVLDAGAGQRTWLRLPSYVHVTGYDADPAVFKNPALNEAHQGDIHHLDLPDAKYDIVTSVWVLEHLERPEQVFKEFARVLKPGGRLFTLTPNNYHYSAMVGRLTPYGFHRRFLNWVGYDEEDDSFPTFHRANSRGKLRKLAAGSGLKVVGLPTCEGFPKYLAFSAPTLLMGAAYERTVNRWGFLSPLRHAIIGIFEKPA